MVGNLDIGKLVTIALFLLIGLFFFGDKAMFWYEHQDDLKFSLSKIVYTQDDFNKMEVSEQTAVLAEVATVCINKHHIDKLSCSDTAYWLAHGLENKGVDVDLAIEWMQPCSDACENGKFDRAVYEERNPVNGKKMNKSSKKTEGTKWIWEED